MTYHGIISAVVENSLAAELGLHPGDRLVAVNGQAVQDIIDLSFALSDEYVEIQIEKANGEQEVYEIEKEYNEDLGLEFESAVFDKVRQCANRCVFCFVDQMPPGMRESLYVKDDDYRLSFLYGNFVTLSNLTPHDKKRMRQLHLSPLYVSVHTTDGNLRSKMLNNKRAANIMAELRQLVKEGIEFHAQIVLCPGINDGKILEKTISDLYELHPAVLSLAIVPVGITRYREKLHPLRVFTPEEARQIITMIGTWQHRCRAERDTGFVYLADEFYLGAGEPIPVSDRYDGFPQLENGVGLIRSFLDEWASESKSSVGYHEPKCLAIICGTSAAKVFTLLLEEIAIPNLIVKLIPIENRFFGPHITVTGLLTGNDILQQLELVKNELNGVIIPGIALRKGESVFLDGIKPSDMEETLQIPVRIAYFAQDLLHLLKEWR